MSSQTTSRHEVSCCKPGGGFPLPLLLSSQQLDRAVFIPTASSPSLPLPLERLGSSHHLETKSSAWPIPIRNASRKDGCFNAP